MGEEKHSEMFLEHQRAGRASHEAFERAYKNDPEFRAWVDRGRERVKRMPWKDGVKDYGSQEKKP